MYKEGGVSLLAKNFIGDELDAQYQIRLLESAGIDKVQIDSINSRSLQLRSYDLDNNKETNSEISSGIGYVMGFLIYIIIFIYGAGVMRGVMEEKTNRIAEVIVSSVKPFQLMMGKIIGIGFVGLTQFGLWAFLMLLLNIALPFLIPGMSDNIPSAMPMTPDVQTTMQTIDDNDKLKLFNAIKDQNWGVILSCFLFYFLGGYFLYAAMFAAVGSLVNEDPQEAQQLTIPITMPIIFGFIIMATSVNDPHSNLSVFGSLFPLTSPIVMMARIPYGVPIWQLILSMGLLVLGFVIMTWLSAKIYRTGILLYGKKVTWKEVLKWIRYS
jgi:ABC-2 type transport system permease protein